MTPVEVLGRWIEARLSRDAQAWFTQAAARCNAAITERDLNLTLSLVGRRIPKTALELSATELEEAWTARHGWDPRDWTLDQAARVYLLCASTNDGALMSERLDRLCGAADVGELVAFYRGLALYPDPPRHVLRAAEGVRSNMRVVFEAVAHRNPYPCEQFAEPAWNQLVLKALFVGSALAPIVGLDERRNATLARMLCDYAHERWAASRPVSPELWRCVGPFASGAMLDDFQRLFEQGTPEERNAATLALRESADAAAKRLLEKYASAAESRDMKGLWERLASIPT